MKKLFLIAVVLLIGGALNANAIDANKPFPVKYEVTISVTWNAVTAEKVAELIALTTKEHEEACSVKVVVKKNGQRNTISLDSLSVTDGTYITIDSSGNIISN